MGQWVLNYIVARLKEPSTYAGTGVLAMLAHSFFPDASQAGAVIQFVAAIGGLVAVFLQEGPRKNDSTVTSKVLAVPDGHGGFVPPTNSRVRPDGTLYQIH